MKRDEFLKLCGLLGISIPVYPVLTACNTSNTNSSNSRPESVLIIGAGPAGMSAGFLLAQQGINFQIIEANSSYGGRIKHNTEFSNFPISMGGEWIHVENSILNEAVNDSSANFNGLTQGYSNSDVVQVWDGSSLSETSVGNEGGWSDLKFVGSSWLGFFETYVLPSIQDNIIYNTPINAVNYESDQVSVTSTNGQTFTADKVIVTVPVKLLQEDVISFTPSLPSNKQQAINNVEVWSGFKAFFKFTSKFYGVYLELPDSETSQGQRIYYDAAYAQNTPDNILGLFSVGTQAEAYQNLSGIAQRDYILNELDTIFGNTIASDNYIDHIVQNWNAEPYAQAAYITDQENWQRVRTLGESVNNKLYFAGDAYTTGDDWSSVHTAIRSARRAVDAMV